MCDLSVSNELKHFPHVSHRCTVGYEVIKLNNENKEKELLLIVQINENVLN